MDAANADVQRTNAGNLGRRIRNPDTRAFSQTMVCAAADGKGRTVPDDGFGVCHAKEIAVHLELIVDRWIYAREGAKTGTPGEMIYIRVLSVLICVHPWLKAF
jgi:hypothetical protein